jgi:dUTP pyrophosphatase
MELPKVLVFMTTNDKDFMPKYESENASGLDLKANLEEENEIVLEPLERVLVNTGIRIELPNGHEGQVRPRSGLALKHGITVLNAPGTIDADYRGDVGVILINLSNEPYTIHHKDRIAQLVIAKVAKISLCKTNTLAATKRGEGGFGHTGK